MRDIDYGNGGPTVDLPVNGPDYRRPRGSRPPTSQLDRFQLPEACQCRGWPWLLGDLAAGQKLHAERWYRRQYRQRSAAAPLAGSDSASESRRQ